MATCCHIRWLTQVLVPGSGGDGGPAGLTSFLTYIDNQYKYCRYTYQAPEANPAPSDCYTPDGAPGPKGSDGNPGETIGAIPMNGSVIRPAFKDVPSVYGRTLDSDQMAMVTPLISHLQKMMWMDSPF